MQEVRIVLRERNKKGGMLKMKTIGLIGGMSWESTITYYENLNKEVKAINDYKKPFGDEILSDERLGIPAEEKPEETPVEQEAQ